MNEVRKVFVNYSLLKFLEVEERDQRLVIQFNGIESLSRLFREFVQLVTKKDMFLSQFIGFGKTRKLLNKIIHLLFLIA